MEACCSRFTAAEGGARLAAAARARNTIAADHTAFVACRLLHEEAYSIRGPLSAGYQRSVYVTRASRVACVAYDIGILTDLAVTSHATSGDVTPDAGIDLEEKQVLVCTSEVARRLLEAGGLSMQVINVLIIDSCHLICKDEHLRIIMKMYKEAADTNRPRILALTYPLFSSPKKHKPPNCQIENDRIDTTKDKDNGNVSGDVATDKDENLKDFATGNEALGVHENTDDFSMYEKLEWKIEELERELSCSADLAEDIDGVKRFSSTVTKPRELVVEYTARASAAPSGNCARLAQYMRDTAEQAIAFLDEHRFSSTVTKPKELVVEYTARASAAPSGNCARLAQYMRDTAEQAIAFLDEHRYDPTEIYGEDLYEELRSIPDPGIEPRAMFQQFLYILDQLGPYGADKAAFSLLMKLEKLKIKVPYERHFLLLCLCTTVFVKIRCFAEDIFSQHESEWEKVELYSTPKVMRLAEILEKFKSNEGAAEKEKKEGETEANDLEKLLKEIEGCDFLTLSNKIEDSVNCLEGNLKELNIEDRSDNAHKSDNSEVVGKTSDNELQRDGNASEHKSGSDICISDTGIHKNDFGVYQKVTGMHVAHKSDSANLNTDTEPSEPNQKSDIGKNYSKLSDQQFSNDDSRDKSEKSLSEFNKTTGQQFSTDLQFPTDHQSPTNPQVPPPQCPRGPRRAGGRAARGRGRGRGGTARAALLLNPDALCGAVYMKEPLMATILFMLCVEMSRHNPRLSFLCSQYSAIEKQADPLTEPREFEKQRRKQEDVLKKFRMHECNLLLATSSLEEGIDLPRCNLVLRWDVPASYRSFGLTRGRARAPRSACVLLSQSDYGTTEQLIHNLATYKELDQIISRKCGCGVQDEPPQSEEEYADKFTSLIVPYSPQDEPAPTPILADAPTFSQRILSDDTADSSDNEGDILTGSVSDVVPLTSSPEREQTRIKDVILANAPKVSQYAKQPIEDVKDKTELEINGKVLLCNKCIGNCEDVSVKCVCGEEIGKEAQRKEDKVETAASVDLSTAIALINRYCGKLPSDTFTRLAPQWWMETVQLPSTATGTEMRTAYICTLRLPLNCPVKYNIVGHPMPTRVLARRMVALQACRILHKSGELDDQLMPIGKDNFKMAALEGANAAGNDVTDIARPGTTKRRQYYYKRTARAFTDCQPVEDCTDSYLESGKTVAPPGGEALNQAGIATATPKEHPSNQTEAPPTGPAPSITPKPDGRRNTLYCIRSTLHCALPERYNTRGRRLHAPQAARQALAILMYHDAQQLQIPSFPVYTRSGEVRVSVECAPAADVRMTPTRGKLVRRFMRFVFAEVLRVRRRGMQLRGGAARNNYYIVPTVKTTNEDGSTKIDVDWAFLEQIYQHTEEKKHSELEKPLFWHLDDEEVADEDKSNICNDKDKNIREDDANSGIEKHNDIDADDSGLGGENSSGDPGIESNNDRNKGCLEKIGSDNNKNKSKAADKDRNTDIDNTVASNDGDNKGPNEIHCEDSKLGENNDKSKDNVTKSDDAITCMEQDANKNSGKSGNDKGKVKKMANPLLKPGETFVFDPEKYREAVVTPWYRNQDQPQFFLVAEICWKLTPDSAFPSAIHTTFRDYYSSKYGVTLTQSDQPLLDVDHTSARLNLLTPRYVNRKGVALPVSSERTRRAKRDRLDQKQILVPELCRVHPFAAPLWFATVALPCVLYRINALLIADEIRRAVALEVGLGLPTIHDPSFQWPPLDFGWSLAEVLSADEKNEKKKSEEEQKLEDVDNETGAYGDMEASRDSEGFDDVEEKREKTINDILQEREDAESGFEIGTWSNDMASSLPDTDCHQSEPLPPNLTLCTSASGGANWSEPVQKRRSEFNPSRTFSVADSDCSYMTSDFDTDDSDLDSEGSDEDTDTSGFFSSKNSSAAMGVRIEYKTAHEAEAVDLERKTSATLAPQADDGDDAADRGEQDRYMRSGDAPEEYIQKFHNSIEIHKRNIIEKGLLIRHNQPIVDVLPEPLKDTNTPTEKPANKEKYLENNTSIKSEDLKELFPYGNEEVLTKGGLNLENIEKHKRILLAGLKNSMKEEEIKKLNCFSMVDVDIDSPNYTSNRITNVGFDCEAKTSSGSGDYKPYYQEGRGETGKEFDFDYQPNLDGHPGPSPSVILQALTMSNANDGINLERLETIGDSFLKFAITAYLYCAHPTVHEGKLSHMRSKQVSNLNLYRLGRDKRLGARMIASKFEPHDNWLPPCHLPPAHHQTEHPPAQTDAEQSKQGEGCFIPYNLITQHSIPDKSIADCVEALIGAYLLWCGPRGALLFMSWLGLRVLPHYTKPAPPAAVEGSTRKAGTLPPYQDDNGQWWQTVYGELRAPPSPLLRYISDPDGELEQMLSGYSALEDTLHYRFRDRSLLLQALTHASHVSNRLTDCYQRLEFLGDAILDYLITRHLYEEPRRHSPGALTDLRSALVNNTIFATLCVRHGLHKYFRHMSPGLNEVLTNYVKIQEENGHSISEEHYLIQEDSMEQAEDVEVPKALGDLFESVAGAIFLDSGMSLGAVWASYVRLMGAELEAFSAAAPKSPVRELLEAEPDTAKFGKPERLADGRRVRVSVEVFGRGCFKGVGRNYRIAKGTAARCALRHLRRHR